VRSHKDLDIEKVDVSPAEMQLALQLIDQIAADSYDPTQYVDEEKKRILAAIDAKIAGKQVVAATHEETQGTGQVIDLMEALRASLAKKPAAAKPAKAAAAAEAEPVAAKELATKERKGAKRAAAPAVAEPVAAPAKARARK
jgi:DNA end-binding protein Ku